MSATVKRIGYVLFSTVAGIVTCTILGAIWIVGRHFLIGGAASSGAAEGLGAAVGLFGFGIGGPLGALLGAWIGAEGAKTDAERAANKAGWIVAVPIAVALFYLEFLRN